MGIKKSLFAVLFLVIGGVTVGGCGPVESLVVINQAKLAIEAAERSEAAHYAPYEYYKARELVHKAREEMNYSDFEVAIDLAVDAKKLATKAREIAITHPDRTDIPPASGGQDSDQID